MDKKKLEELLISRRTRLYCVLDGAMVDDLPNKLHKSELPNVCLFRGKLEPDVVYLAPYLVGLLPGHELTDFVLAECIGKNAGIFAHSRHSIGEMRKHFRSIVSVHDENGKPLIFRFYDPRVFRKFIPTCKKDELETFFGKVDTFFVETETADDLNRYDLKDGAVKETLIDLS